MRFFYLLIFTFVFNSWVCAEELIGTPPSVAARNSASDEIPMASATRESAPLVSPTKTTAVRSSVAAQVEPPVLERVLFESVSAQLGFDQEIWSRREALLVGIEDNLRFLASPEARKSYEKNSNFGVTLAHVQASLERFKFLLETSSGLATFNTKVAEEFILYQSVGRDGQGLVKFTGYFQPIYQARRKRSSAFPYPLYGLPPDFAEWPKPHLTRVTLEGYDGRGVHTSPVYQRELAFLATRWEAFMVHVQGSAILELGGGERMSVGFAGGTDYPFRGVTQGFMRKHGVVWTKLAEFFVKKPDLLNQVLEKNNRFIFFEERSNPEPIGSIGVPVIPERSIATDKLRMPPGALGLIRTVLPRSTKDGKTWLQTSSRLVLDQDTGSAIKGPGRVDVFMGTGSEAQKKANQVFSNGELYYLLLKEH